MGGKLWSRVRVGVGVCGGGLVFFLLTSVRLSAPAPPHPPTQLSTSHLLSTNQTKDRAELAALENTSSSLLHAGLSLSVKRNILQNTPDVRDTASRRSGSSPSTESVLGGVGGGGGGGGGGGEVGGVGEGGEGFPEWWRRAWSLSAVSGSQGVRVGDHPLFPPCSSTQAQAPSGFYSFVEPKAYVSNSRNPCWYDHPGTQKGLHCAPYFYLAGVAKCGTTDIAKRLKRHPQVFGSKFKEFHWWERFRFGSYDEEKMEITGEGQTFREYLDDLSGEFIKEMDTELRVNGSSKKIFGDYSPSYLWDPQNWNLIDGNQLCTEPRVIVGQHIYHLYPKAKIILTFRHPTPRLYSRFRSRIHRTPWLRSSPEAFHHYVKGGVKAYMDCFKTWSIRHCAYSVDTYKQSVVRLVEGMYPVFMADWLRVWPRDQLHIMRYEDYGGQERQRLMELFSFLNLDPPSEREMEHILEMDVANSGSADYEKYGAMLPETKQMLDDFYRPFVRQFAIMLNDSRFLWKDVYQEAEPQDTGNRTLANTTNR